jgi:hypothetical protein
VSAAGLPGCSRLELAQGVVGIRPAPAVLASLLTVHIQTAVNWASRTRRAWTAYLAERIRAQPD